MTFPLCSFSKTPSSLTKTNLPLTLSEDTFLAYTMFFFRDLQVLNMPYYYFSTSAEINADFKRFCDTHKFSHLFTSSELQVHSLGMSIRDKVQFIQPSEFAQNETDRLKRTGFCISNLQLRFIVATAKIVLDAISNAKNTVK